MSKQLEFKNFEEIPVSTKTFIIMTNIVIDIQKLFNFLPITQYTLVQKKRGRKKKTVQVNPNKNILERFKICDANLVYGWFSTGVSVDSGNNSILVHCYPTSERTDELDKIINFKASKEEFQNIEIKCNSLHLFSPEDDVVPPEASLEAMGLYRFPTMKMTIGGHEPTRDEDDIEFISKYINNFYKNKYEKVLLED